MGCSGSKQNSKPPARRMTKSEPTNHKEVTDLIKEFKLDSNPTVNEEYTLKLDARKPKHVEFMDRCSKYKLPNLGSLQIINITKLSAGDERIINTFLTKSAPNGLHYLNLNSGSAPTYPKTANIFDGFAKIMSVTRDEIFFDGFELENETLARVFESASNCGRLCLINCNIRISAGFKLNKTIQYAIEYLDLFNSYYPQDLVYLSLDTLKIFTKEASGTSLTKSLNTVHLTAYRLEYKTDKERSKDEYEAFNNNGFKNIKIEADKNWTIPGSRSNKRKTQAAHW